jgi:hypothetical protein
MPSRISPIDTGRAVDVDSWRCCSPPSLPSHRCSPSPATVKTCACAFRSAPCRDPPPMLSRSSSPHCLPPHACLIRFPGIPLPSATIKPLSDMRYTPSPSVSLSSFPLCRFSCPLVAVSGPKSYLCVRFSRTGPRQLYHQWLVLVALIGWRESLPVKMTKRR